MKLSLVVVLLASLTAGCAHQNPYEPTPIQDPTRPPPSVNPDPCDPPDPFSGYPCPFNSYSAKPVPNKK